MTITREYTEGGVDFVPKDSAAHVGDRGGVYYDNKDKVNIGVSQTNSRGSKDYPPTYILQGPGVDIAFFRTDGGFTVKYAGPYCEEAISLAKTMLDSHTYSFKEMIDMLCKEFNCCITNDAKSNRK